MIDIFAKWIIKRRKERRRKLAELMARYHIVPGENYWYMSPWMVERMISRSMKRAKPISTTLPPDKPEIAELRKRLVEYEAAQQ